MSNYTAIMTLFQDIPLNIARKRLINAVTTEYTVVLDYNTILPEGYVEHAIELLQVNKDSACVAIPTNESIHAVFGTSVWKTSLLKELYDWDGVKDGCECEYMWRKLYRLGYVVVTIDGWKARHLK